MRKEIKPPVAIAIVVVVVLAAGYFIYMKANSGQKGIKPVEAMSMPGFKDALRQKYEAQYGKR